MTVFLKDAKDARGLLPDDRALLSKMLDVWESHLTRNSLKNKYYDGENRLKNLGIAIPEKLEDVECVVGWPAKAVDYLASRSIFDGFVYEGDKNDDFEKTVSANEILFEYSKAVTSELINGCAFATVSRGDPLNHEPKAVVNFYSAESATGIWNKRLKRLEAGLVVAETKPKKGSPDKEPTRINMYTSQFVIEIIKDPQGGWYAKYSGHPMGRPMMEVMAYKPSLKNPFGKSRVTRTVMRITDSAMRACLRAELSSEFYTTPQKYLLGADDEDFDKPKWEAYIGAIFLAGKDADGDIPKFGQLPQASMQPHIEYKRDLAAQFAGETSIPISSLGVIHDNPASAEAIYAAKEDLVTEAQYLNALNGKALCNLAKMVVAIQENVSFDAVPDQFKSMKAHFKNPAMPSIVSQADAMMKISAVAPWIAESEVFLEEVGYDEATRKRLIADKAKLEAQKMIANRMLAAGKDNGDGGNFVPNNS